MGGINRQHDAVTDPTLGKSLRDIFSAIPRTKKRIGVDKWHRVLVQLQSMQIYLPGDRGLFSNIQEALCYVKGNRVTLTKGVHQDLEYFLWMAQDLERRPTSL